MKMNKLTYEITMRAGDYQSIKIGGEWSVDHNPTSADIATLDTMLRQQVEDVLRRRKADAESKPEQPQAQPEQPQPEQPQAQPEEDKRELVTTSKADEKKLKAILKKIQDGTPEEVVRKFFRFDEKAEFLVNTALQDVMRS